MSSRPVVVPPGHGHRVGNVEFLARTADTPRFNLGIIEIAPGRELEGHIHADEDDAFYIMKGELTFTLHRVRLPGHRPHKMTRWLRPGRHTPGRPNGC